MRKALIIGVDDYPSTPLYGCVNDAIEVKNALESNGDGSPNFGIKIETNVTTKSSLKGLIVELFSGDADIALFYFSGHGYTDKNESYIVTPDYKKNDEGVSMDQILNIANSSKIKNKVIILDCCFSGAFGSPKILGENACHIGEGISILTASKSDEPSMEINGHGVFTNLLIDALKGGAADLQGHITPGSIYAYIDQALGPWHQRPVFKTNISKFTSLKKVTPQVPIEKLRKLIEYFHTPTEEFKLDPSFEYTNSKDIEHKVLKPYANTINVEKFKNIQKLESVGLVIPVDEEHMYYAAMNSKSCKLTALGCHYWRLIKERRI